MLSYGNTNQQLTRSYIDKQLTNHSSAREREIDEE